MSNKLKIFLESTWIIWSIIIVLIIAVSLIIDILYPVKSIGNSWTWEGVLMFLTVCAGIGWVIHGTGFLLVKVD